MWEQMSKAGFISGSYLGTGGGAEPTASNGLSPFNPFGGAIIVVRSNDYLDVSAARPARLHLIVGRRTPVDVSRELDVKLDDSRPSTGGLRSALSPGAALAGTPAWGGSSNTCTTTVTNPAADTTTWDVATDDQDCNTVFLF